METGIYCPLKHRRFSLLSLSLTHTPKTTKKRKRKGLDSPLSLSLCAVFCLLCFQLHGHTRRLCSSRRPTCPKHLTGKPHSKTPHAALSTVLCKFQDCPRRLLVLVSSAESRRRWPWESPPHRTLLWGRTAPLPSPCCGPAPGSCSGGRRLLVCSGSEPGRFKGLCFSFDMSSVMRCSVWLFV